MISPTDFSKSATDWIDAIFGVFNHLLGLIIMVLGSAAYMQLKNRLDQHREELNLINPKVIPVPNDPTKAIQPVEAPIPPTEVAKKEVTDIPKAVVQIPVVQTPAQIVNPIPPSADPIPS